MTRTLTLVLLLFLAVSVASAQAPSVPAGGILNSASYAMDGLPGAGVAQGSIFVIYGTAMGPATGMYVTSTFPLPTTLGGTEVKITSGGTTVNALLIFVRADFIQAVLPSSTPVGAATLTVTYNGQTSTPTPFNVNRSGFGMYTINQAGSGPAVVTNPSYTVNTLTAAMTPGSTLTLWGTGLGPATVPADEPSKPVVLDPAVASQVQVWVGGKQAQVSYAGRGGGFAGLDQINFVVPDGLSGCYVPIYVKIGDSTSNYASISLGANGANFCSDSYSFSAGDLQKAQTTGKLRIGSVSLSRTAISMSVPGAGSFEMKNDAGTATFQEYNMVSLLRTQLTYGISVVGSCIVHAFKGTDYANVDPVAASAVMLDAGPSLQLTGPNGNKTIEKSTAMPKGVYYSSYSSAIPNPTDPGYLGPGHYTVTGAGGTEVGAFTASMDIPALLTWTNQDSITDVTRSQGQQILWTGGSANDAVMIMGVAMLDKPEVGASFVCTEAASKGSFTIPPAVLQALPAVTTGSSGAGLLMLGTLPVFSQNKFTASGIDVGVFLYSTFSARNVNYK